MQRSLRGVTVAQVMSRDCPTVPRLLTLSKLVETRVLFGAQRCFSVAENGHLHGLLTLREIVAIPRPQWRTVTTGEAMVPFERLARVAPPTELLAALRTMDDANVAQVPVIEEDEIVGILSREQVLRHIRLRSELGVSRRRLCSALRTFL